MSASLQHGQTVSDNPYVFVVGCPRSGTTLLQRMLDSHPLLAVANDTHFIPRALAGMGEANPELTPELAEKVWAYHRFNRLGLTRDDLDAAAADSHTYSTFVSRLYDTFGRKRQKPLAGEKTPDYARHIPVLHGLFPRARFVHIVRDGRDVALSALDWATPKKGPGRWTLWDSHPVATCALWWRWQIEGALDARLLLGPGVVHEVLYEDLVAAPETQLRRIARFLDLEYDSAMEQYNRGKIRQDSNASAKSAWLSPTSGLRDWRQQMAPDDVSVFQALAGDLLNALGYETTTCAAGGAVARVSEECLSWWSECDGKPATRRRADRRLTTTEGS